MNWRVPVFALVSSGVFCVFVCVGVRWFLGGVFVFVVLLLWLLFLLGWCAVCLCVYGGFLGLVFAFLLFSDLVWWWCIWCYVFCGGFMFGGPVFIGFFLLWIFFLFPCRWGVWCVFLFSFGVCVCVLWWWFVCGVVVVCCFWVFCFSLCVLWYRLLVGSGGGGFTLLLGCSFGFGVVGLLLFFWSLFFGWAFVWVCFFWCGGVDFFVRMWLCGWV